VPATTNRHHRLKLFWTLQKSTSTVAPTMTASVTTKKRSVKRKTAQARPNGRPTLYRQDYADQARKLCLLGATDAELADFFGVPESTLNGWKLAHPGFLESIREGKVKADAEVANSLRERAVGAEWTEQQAIKIKVGPHQERVEVVEVRRAAPPDTQAAVMWLKNRRPRDWRDKQEFEHAGTLTLESLVTASLKQKTE
jgi:hypothetical protein